MLKTQIFLNINVFSPIIQPLVQSTSTHRIDFNLMFYVDISTFTLSCFESLFNITVISKLNANCETLLDNFVDPISIRFTAIPAWTLWTAQLLLNLENQVCRLQRDEGGLVKVRLNLDKHSSEAIIWTKYQDISITHNNLITLLYWTNKDIKGVLQMTFALRLSFGASWEKYWKNWASEDEHCNVVVLCQQIQHTKFEL